MVSTPELIRRLAADAAPVRRLPPPWHLAARWIVAGILVMGIVGLINGVRPDLASKLEQAPFLLQVGASLMTGITAAIAAFHLSLADRSPAWSLVPIPAMLAWLLGLGWGCVTNWVEITPEGVALDPTLRCLATVVMTSVPLLALLLAMLRHAGPIRPRATAAVGALGVAAMAASALMLFHDLDATVMVLAWNFGTMALLTAGLGLAGRGAFSGSERA